jgi:hypothetical protein
MVALTQNPRAAAFLISESNKSRSRETVTIVSGQNLKAGTVVGKVTASGKYAAYDDNNVDGTETAAGVLYDGIDATAGDQLAVIYARDAEVDGTQLAWAATVTAGEKTTAIADLKALGIIVR